MSARASLGGARALVFFGVLAALPPMNLAQWVINMLVFTGGQERTNAEYRELLQAGGLKAGRVLPVAFPYGVIEARAE